MKIKNVTIAGAGVMGSQISWQSAFHGFDVNVYDPFEKGLERGKELHQDYAKLFVEEGRGSQEEVDSALNRIKYSSNMEDAFKNADLVSESVPEDTKIKKEFWQEVSKVAPKNALLTTNSSSFVPSDLVDVVENPERFLAMHFWSGIWDNNLGEVMPHKGTSEASFDATLDFTEKIGMLPVPIKVEYPGYVINALLIPWLISALKLHFLGISDYKTVDKVWMVPNGGSKAMGPFAHMDTFGLNVVYHITKNAADKDPDMEIISKGVKEQFIDKGKLGKASGEGFYKYPNPEFQDPSFLK